MINQLLHGNGLNKNNKQIRYICLKSYNLVDQIASNLQNVLHFNSNSVENDKTGTYNYILHIKTNIGIKVRDSII